MDVTYQVEQWDTFYPDFLPLWEHFHFAESRADETAQYRAFNAPGYAAMAANDMLHIMTARDVGQLVGYFVSFIVPHMNQADCLYALSPLYFLHPAYRGKGVGGRLVKATEAHLKAHGAMFMIVGAKTYLPYRAVFEHYGYRDVETTLLKDLR